MPGLFDTIAGVAPSLNAPLYNTSLADPSLGIQPTQAPTQGQDPSSAMQMLLGHAVGSMLGGGQSQGQPQPQTAPQPSAVPNHSLTGILGIHGVPGQLLNWLGDTIATAGGMQLPFKDDPAKRAQAAALSNLQGDPQGAVAKLAATGDTQGALDLQNSLANRQIAMANMQREGMTAADQHQAAVQKYDDTRRSQAGKLISSATPDTYESLYGKTQDVFGKTTDLSPLNLPDPKNLSQYVSVDPNTGQKTWNDQGKAILDQANTFNVPEYKYLGTGAAQTTAAARTQGASNGQALVPSEIARNYGQAAAGGVNASAHQQQAGAQVLQAQIALGKAMGIPPGGTIPGTNIVMTTGLPQGGVAPMKSHRPVPVAGVTTSPAGAPSAAPTSDQMPTIPANRVPSTAVRGKINGHPAVQVGGKTYLIQ